MNSVIIGLFITLVVFGLFYYLQKKHLNFGMFVFLSMILGVLAGIVFKDSVIVFDSIGQVYVHLIKMLVVPLVFTTLITSLISLKDHVQLKRIGVKTISWFLFTAALASLLGLLIAKIFNPGSNVTLSHEADFQPIEIPPVNEVIVNFIPSNPIGHMANGEVIPIVILTLLLGIALNIENSKHPDKVEHVIKFFTGFSKIMFRLTKMILKLTPYGVFGLIANVSAKYGLDTLLPLGSFIVTVYIACLVHLLFTYGGLVLLIGKINPFIFFKRVYPAMVVAFTSRSSYGTLPVTLEVIIQRLKVPEKIAHFVAPLGATINMDGCGGLYPAIVAVFVSSIYGIDLSFTQYILIIAISTIATIGTAGVPGTASVMTTVVLSSVGLPVEGLALVIGVDAIVDMARTTVNVTGDTVVSLLVAKSEKELDEERFYNAKELDLIKDI